MNKLVIFALAFIATVMSAPIPDKANLPVISSHIYRGYPGIVESPINYAAPILHYGPASYVPTYYGFGYGVNDPYHGLSFGHNENKDGYKTTGAYYVSLPDNRLQQVSYYADQTGYHPTVTYV